MNGVNHFQLGKNHYFHKTNDQPVIYVLIERGFVLQFAYVQSHKEVVTDILYPNSISEAGTAVIAVLDGDSYLYAEAGAELQVCDESKLNLTEVYRLKCDRLNQIICLRKDKNIQAKMTSTLLFIRQLTRSNSFSISQKSLSQIVCLGIENTALSLRLLVKKGLISYTKGRRNCSNKIEVLM